MNIYFEGERVGTLLSTLKSLQNAWRSHCLSDEGNNTVNKKKILITMSVCLSVLLRAIIMLWYVFSDSSV